MSPGHAQSPDPALQALVTGPQRTEKNRVRDPYRHPGEVLAFFGVKPDSTVLEILPGSGGFWMEILAPYLHDRGRYIAAIAPDASSEEARKDNPALRARLSGLFDKVEVTTDAAGRYDRYDSKAIVGVACPASAPVRQIGDVEDRRISGSS